MKKSINILTCTLIFATCIGQDYTIENQLLNCIYKTTDSAGIDIKKEFNKFEKALIEYKMLNDNSGKSYYNLYKQFKEAGNTNYSFSYYLLDTISKNSRTFDFDSFQLEISNCFEKILTNKSYNQSDHITINHASDSLKQFNDYNLSLVSNAITKVLTPMDFEHEFYKIAFMFSIITINAEDTLIEKNQRLINNEK